MTFLQNDELIILNDLIYSVNAISDECEMRKHFLETLRFLIPFYCATFFLGDMKSENPLIKSVGVDMDLEKQVSYDKYYYKIDYARKFNYVRNSVVYRETDLFDQHEREKTEYYNDYLQPHVHFLSSVFLANQEGLQGNINLCRKKEYGDFSEKDLFILRMLTPHLTNRLYHMKQQIAVKGEYDTNCISHFSSKYKLTSREFEILDLVIHGCNNYEIGSKLFISLDTVKKHVSNIFNKLGINSRVQLLSLLNGSISNRGIVND